MRGGARRSIAAPMSWCPAMPPSTVPDASPWRRSSGRRCRAPATQTILGGGGYRLALDADGRLTLHLDGWQLAAKRPLHPAPLVSHSGEPRCGRGRDPLRGPGSDSGRRRQRDLPRQAAGRRRTGRRVSPSSSAPISASTARSAGHFNGKIEAPCLAAEALAPADLAALLGRPRDFPLLAAWDFARDIETVFIPDIGPRGLHGRAVNLPARGVTGHLWAGRSLSWREAPADYAAIHFHEDDLYDCGWETNFSLADSGRPPRAASMPRGCAVGRPARITSPSSSCRPRARPRRPSPSWRPAPLISPMPIAMTPMRIRRPSAPMGRC